MAPKNIFEKNLLLSMFCIVSIFLLGGLIIADSLAAKFFGLGKVVIYQTNPIYGYRLQPNQTVARKPGQMIKINNLGLRAEQDWDPQNFQHKILFLGDSITYGGSYIANTQLFSHLVGKNFPEFMVGNAGVNAWGVNNVHGLVKETDFVPAEIFVSVFPEGDFYRGLSRISGQPFWTKKPRFALEELGQFFIYKLHLRKTPETHEALLSVEEKTKIVEIAVRNLKELDTYLKRHQRHHFIYITPSKTQLLKQSPNDPIIQEQFEKYGLKVVYLRDHLKYLSIDEIKSCYHDDAHLSVKGHEVWAKMLSQDLAPVLQEDPKTSELV